MTILIGLVFTMVCILGSFVAMGGHIEVVWQPFEYIIILGSGIGAMIVANPMKVLKDTGKGTMEALKNAVPKNVEYLEILGVLYSLMRELRGKSRNEVEGHIEKPQESPLFQKYPTVLANDDLTTFICDYVRLIIIGNARTHEIESLMDEEIQTVRADKLKAYHAVSGLADSLPALGIVAAVLGVIKTMGAITEPPEILGSMIGGALVGTFLGVFLAYGLVGPIALRLKAVIDEEFQFYRIIQSVLVAHLHGNAAQISVEIGRGDVPSKAQPSFLELEEALTAAPADA